MVEKSYKENKMKQEQTCKNSVQVLWKTLQYKSKKGDKIKVKTEE